MAYKKTIYKNDVSFSTSTDDIVVDSSLPTEKFTLGYRATQPAAGPSTIAAFLDLVSLFEVKLNSVPYVQIGGKDLYAFNNFSLGHRPLIVGTGAVNEITRAIGISVPVSWTPDGRILSVKANTSGVGSMTSQAITIAQVEHEAPLARGLSSILTYNFTPPSTGAFNRALDIVPDGDVEGMLVFSTTIPTTSANTKTVNELQIRSGGTIVYSASWEEMQSDMSAGAIDGASTIEGILDNYAWLDFSSDPFKAGTRLEVFVKSDDTNAVRLIPLVRYAARA